MKVEILFNSHAIHRKFFKGWGFSCLINDRVLFDTGENEEYLLNNMTQMNVDVSKIEAVILSHEHWDHIDGLWGILKQKKGIAVYVCPRFSIAFKEKIEECGGVVIEVDTFTEVVDNIFVTGEIAGTYKGEYMPEQALVLKTGKGISVITGCAHPGIIKILENIKDHVLCESYYFVLGGFHLKDSSKNEIDSVVRSFQEMKVQKVGPTHCSGDAAQNIFKQIYGNDMYKVEIGHMFEM